MPFSYVSYKTVIPGNRLDLAERGVASLLRIVQTYIIIAQVYKGVLKAVH